MHDSKSAITKNTRRIDGCFLACSDSLEGYFVGNGAMRDELGHALPRASLQ